MTPRTQSTQPPGLRCSRCALVHHVDSPGPGSLHIVFFKTFFDSPTQFATYGILFVWARLDKHQVFGFAVTHTVDPGHINVADNVVSKPVTVPNVFSHLLQQVHNLVARLAIGHRHSQGQLRPVARGIRDDLDGTVRHNVQGPIFIAQYRVSKAHALDCPIYSSYAHRVTNVVLIFEQYEKTIDEVVHQRL